MVKLSKQNIQSIKRNIFIILGSLILGVGCGLFLVPYNIVSGGTDNHLILVDLNNKNITGKEAESLLDSVGITVNKNTVPNETRSPFVTSGVRIGTPAVTTRGFKEDDMKEIASIINDTIEHRNEDLSAVKERVKVLCRNHPLY